VKLSCFLLYPFVPFSACELVGNPSGGGELLHQNFRRLVWVASFGLTSPLLMWALSYQIRETPLACLPPRLISEKACGAFGLILYYVLKLHPLLRTSLYIYDGIQKGREKKPESRGQTAQLGCCVEDFIHPRLYKEGRRRRTFGWGRFAPSAAEERERERERGGSPLKRAQHASKRITPRPLITMCKEEKMGDVAVKAPELLFLYGYNGWRSFLREARDACREKYERQRKVIWM